MWLDPGLVSGVSWPLQNTTSLYRDPKTSSLNGSCSGGNERVRRPSRMRSGSEAEVCRWFRDATSAAVRPTAHTTEPQRPICCLFLPQDCGIPAGKHALQPALTSHWRHINGDISSAKAPSVRSALSLSVWGKVAQKEGHPQRAEPTLMLIGSGAQAQPERWTRRLWDGDEKLYLSR